MTTNPPPPPDDLALHAFSRTLPFALDPFQAEAIRDLRTHAAVLVSSPTSSGKTVVAEAAIWHCLEAPPPWHEPGTVCYTAPLKALSNQKFTDLCRRYGPERVGLLTGENAIRPEAPVVVMTTEILRNLIYEEPERLAPVRTVVLDEVHYIDDYPRGTVWEEVIVQAPRHIRFIGLSATITNVEEVAEWMRQQRGPVKVVQRTERPVELRTWLGMGNRFHRLLDSGGRIERQTFEQAQEASHQDQRLHVNRALVTADNDLLGVIRELQAHDMVPAIYFIFSRRGCREAMARCATHGVDLTTLAEKHRIDEVLTERLAAVDDPQEAELYMGMLQADRLRAGVGMHHAGLLPYLKETVEALFQMGLLKVVFATETLALGLNMPARACVVSTFTKYDGQGFASLRSGQLAQLLGRAGRRGIDTVGHGIILRDPDVDLGVIYETVLGDDMAVESKFAPTHNMTLNLLRRHTPEESAQLLRRSFGQFQRERAVVHLHSQRANLLAKVDDLRQRRFRHPRVRCTERTLTRFLHAGAAAEALRQELRRLRRSHWQARQRGRSGPRPADPGGQVEALRRRIRQAEREAGTAPCRGCPLLAEHQATRNEIRDLEHSLTAATRETEARVGQYQVQFDAFRRVLTVLGHLAGDRPTRTGELAAKIYGEGSLLVTEAVIHGWLDHLDPAELAATLVMVSAEDRNPDRAAIRPRLPSPAVEQAWRELRQGSRRIGQLEHAHGIGETRPLSLDHVAYVHGWCRGVALTALQPAPGVDPGDAVRATKGCYALLRQLEAALPGWPLHATVRTARQAMERDLVRRL